MRVGHGVDVHRFGGQEPLVLCGVVVDDRGVHATSDGDVAAHALTDAILGAAALGDIGMQAPEDDPASHGADSMQILSAANARLDVAGYAVVNVDVTLVVQEVRISPHRDEMRAKVATALGIDLEAVSVKATTTDGLGFLGRDEGVAAVATAVIDQVL